MDHGTLSPKAFVDRFRAKLASLPPLAEAVTRRRDGATDEIRDGNAEWTNVLLNTVLELGVEHGFTPYPRRLYFRRPRRGVVTNSKYDVPPRSGDRGEYLFDASWTTYPRTDREWLAEIARGPAPGARLRLICESEWVSSVRGPTAVDDHRLRVLYDFAKLVDVSAPVRVLLFTFMERGDASFEALAALCAKAAGAREHDDPSAGYALLGWPRSAWWEDRVSSMQARLLEV